MASEVRSLAHRSTAAAKEIKELIRGSVEAIERGSALVNTSGATLGNIVDAVQRVATLIAKFAAASEELADLAEHRRTAVGIRMWDRTRL